MTGDSPAGSGPDGDELSRAVGRGDLDELTGVIGRLAHDERWDSLVDLRDRCRRALERGKQLWPAASLCEYRLALDAPAPWAASVLVPEAGRFALGPLPEVAASTHTWAELRPHAPSGPVAAMAAHERVVRGEDATAAPPSPAVLDLPLQLAAWEPAYPVAQYEPDRARFPAPAEPALTATTRPTAGAAIDDGGAARALSELVQAWTVESNGRADSICVRGPAAAATASLGAPTLRMAELDPATAMAWLAWAGASGGAHGRRRGMASGRFGAWWVLAALGDLLDEWPVPTSEMGELCTELRWFAWDAGEPRTGWNLHLAIEDPAEGLSWAIAASDSAI